MNELTATDTCEITTPEFLKRIEIMAYVGIGSSLLTIISTFTIIVFVFYKGTFSLSQVKPLLHLTIADFLLAYIWFSSNLDYLHSLQNNDGVNIYKKEKAVHCFVWQVLAETMHLTTFGFTINYSVNVYLTMKQRADIGYIHSGGLCHGGSFYIAKHGVKRHNEYRRSVSVFVAKVKKYCYIAFWIMPGLSMIPILIKVDEDHICLCERCVILIDVPRLVHTNLFHQSYGFVLLACALVTAMILVIVFYVLTLRLYWRSVPGYRTDRERKKFRNVQRRVTLYVAVFVICWFPALVIAIAKSYEMINSRGNSLRQTDIKTLFPLYLLQTILTPLQGFFNTIVYGWTRASFRRATRPVLDSAMMRNPILSEIDYSQSSLPPDSDFDDAVLQS